jgi:hypothetical protein
MITLKIVNAGVGLPSKKEKKKTQQIKVEFLG